MNKKILYSLVLTSIFIMSIASVCMPVAGDTRWKFGVPDAAKGMKLQSEVKVYDKEQWGDSLGTCLDDSVNEKFGGDGTGANDVGARSQSEISDWESDDRWFFGDDLMTSDVPPACDGSKVEFGGAVLTDYWSAAVTVEEVLRGLGTITGTRTPSLIDPNYFAYLNPGAQDPDAKIAILESILAFSMARVDLYAALGRTPTPAWYLTPGTSNNTLYNAMTKCTDLFAESTYTRAEITARYAKTYKTMLVTMDKWDFALDLESDPDEEDKEAPFIKDPEDLYDSFLYFNGFLNDEFALMDAMIYQLILVNTTYQAMKNEPVGNEYVTWLVVNGTIATLVQTLLYQKLGPIYGNGTWAGLIVAGFCGNMMDFFVDALLCYDGTHPIQGGSPGLMQIVPFFIDETPQQDKEYLALLFGLGIPAHQPVDKWLEDLIDEFDVDDDAWFGDNIIYYPDIILRWPGKEIKGVPVTDILNTGGISVDGLVVTVEYEWPEGLLNTPTDPDSERDDYEVVYTYGDTGGQSNIEYYSGDTLFYKIEGIAPTIIGYEVSILLGAAAIATLGLIYVVIKKRRM